MPKVNLVTQAEYARLRGVSRVAVGKAVKGERISLVNGLIDPAVADVQWAANTRARVSSESRSTEAGGGVSLLGAGAVSTGSAGQETELGVQTSAQTSAGDLTPSSDSYAASRNRREAADADLAELSLAEKQGNLIRVDAVKQALANAFTATRDSLLQIPSRLSAVLAAETDAAKVHELLQAELYRALEGIAAVQSSNRLSGRDPQFH